ncbi:MAG: mannose-6-phosphate isomerase, class I [Myxococcaceae bacterium]|nr:mannose-6-phosphate isomerase, class I [Myxococcaceae bacterium]
MRRLENQTQAYAWGSATAIPELLGVAATGAPQAELWIGAHPLAPSRLEGRSLDAIIAERPQALLGPASVARFGPRLPFLLKVLAAAQPLSLQAHPSRAQAQAGFARENAAGVPLTAPHRTYKDDNHKPELLCALTPFRALCGFRALDATRTLLRALEVDRLRPLLATLDAGLAGFFQQVMTLPRPDATALVADVAEACATRPVRGFEAECRNAVALARVYPGDVGVVGALLLNLVELAPGEALALGAGNLHAYLEGTGIELMANSDNVLRGGLTPKHVDVAELLRVLDFSSGPAPIVRPQGQPEAVYPTGFPDFRLSRIDVSGPLTLARLGADVMVCTAGTVEVNGLMLARGVAGFAGLDEGPLTCDGEGTLYRATVNA